MIWVAHSRAMLARGWGEPNAKLLPDTPLSIGLLARNTNELYAERTKINSNERVLNILLSHPRANTARDRGPQQLDFVGGVGDRGPQ